MKYGLLQTSSINIGDEIQCLAATRFIPKVDVYVHRENTKNFWYDEPVKVIMNHYWLHKKNTFPPSSSIEPLYVSFHLKYTLRNRSFLKGEVFDHFKKNEPIGCRDQGTADFLQSAGINAYFSGCLTTTLLPNTKLKHKFFDDYILCVDVPEDVVETIKQRTEKKVLSISRHQNVCFNTEDRFKLAKYTLFLYHNAYCVVTIALHAAIPSTAFGTPVCVLEYEDKERSSRFDGLEGLFNWVKISDFINDEYSYDINNPPRNPEKYKEFAEPLAKRCERFTGYDSNASIFEDDYNPIYDMATIMRQNKDSENKVLWFVKQSELLKTFLLRFFKLKDRHMI